MKTNKKYYIAGAVLLSALIIVLSAVALATAPGKEPVQPFCDGINYPTNGEGCDAANCPMKECGTCPKEDGACTQKGTCSKNGACPMKDGGTCLKEDGACLQNDSCPKNEACSMKNGGTCPKEDGACTQNGDCPKNGACPMKDGGTCPKEDSACPKNEACSMKDANTCQMGEKKPDFSMVAAPVPERACPMGGGMGGACQRKGF